MSRQTTLTIRFESDEPSIKRHRLSVSVFHDSLHRLVQALRRIASGIDSDAWGPEEYGHRGGRFTKQAAAIDWEITSINGHSPLEISGAVVQRFEGDEALLFEPPESTDLTDSAAERLLTALDKERGGHSYHLMVRKYLQSLPTLSRQEYEVSTTEGKTLDRVIITDVELPEREEGLPVLEEIVAEIVGVGFDPGSNEVRLSTDGEKLTLAATAEQVERALELRGNSVAAFFVRQPDYTKNKLLSLRPADESGDVLDSQAAEDHVFEKWGGLLKRLAE